MVYEGYLSFGGNEIVNSPRAYGLQLTAPCDSGWLRDPGCESLQEILGDTIYTHDNIASAPWYDPSFPESARFYGVYGLGFYGLKDSTRQVQVTEGLASGGVVGSSRKGVLPLRVRASLLAEGDDAMEYGRSWLEAALSPGACGQHGEECGTADVQFFSTCPPGRAIVRGFSDWREYARNYMQTPSFEGMEAAGETVEVYRNLALNPSMEAGSGTVEVRRNLNTNPRMDNSTAGWTVSGGVTQTPTADGTRLDFPSGATGTAFFYQASEVPVGVGVNVQSSLTVSVPEGFPAVTGLYIRTYAYGSNVTLGESQKVNLTAGQAVVLSSDFSAVIPTPAGTTGVRTIMYATSPIPAGARILVRRALLEKVAKLGPYFDGDISPDPDVAPSWTGVANASESVLSGVRPANTVVFDERAFVYQSAAWASSGAKSARVTPILSDSFLQVSMTTVVGKTYTLYGTLRLTAPQSGSLHARARQISWGGAELVHTQTAPNEAGVWPVRATWVATSTMGNFRFYNGAPAGGGDVWWDDIMILEGVYNGPYFDGSTQPRVRENHAPRPIADDTWSFAPGPGSSVLSSTVDDPRFGGDRARKVEFTTSGNGGYLNPLSTLSGIQVGDVWTFSMRYALSNYSGAEPFMNMGGGNPPLGTVLGSGTVDQGDGTKVAWRTVRITDAKSGAATPILQGFGVLPTGATLLTGSAMWERSTTLGEWFSGDTPQDPGFSAAWEGLENRSRSYVFDVDFAPGWMGAANASASVLWGQGAYPVLGNFAVPILSSRWSKSGKKSLRLVAKGAGVTTNTFAAVIVPPAIRSGGTFMATSYIPTSIGTVGGFVGALLTNSPQADARRATSVGEESLRVNYPAFTSGYQARFYHGGPEGSADVWWDAAGLFAGNHDGPWFDGNSEPTGDPDLSRYRWLGDINFSESVYEVRERTSREQTDEEWAESVDDVRRFLHGVAAVSGPLTVSETRRDGMVRQTVEFTLEATRPWVYGVTRTVDLPRTQSSVIEDVQYNLVPYPSMEAADGAVTIAENLATNPSVEVDAAGWAFNSGAISGSDPSTYITSGRTTELAAVGAASLRVRLLGNGATTASGSAHMSIYFNASISSAPARARISFNIWGALVKSAGSSATTLTAMNSRVDWISSSGTQIGSSVMLGTATTAQFGGFAFSARSLLPPAGAVTARVVVRGEATWESSATPANNSDIRLYADALAVTIP